MSIQEEIERISNAKEDIKESIIAKGVEVSDEALISDYSAAINAIPTPSDPPTATLDITENGEYDVTAYATADVNVAGGGGGQITFDTSVSGNQSTATDTVALSIPSGMQLNDLQLAYSRTGTPYEVSTTRMLNIDALKRSQDGYMSEIITLNGQEIHPRVLTHSVGNYSSNKSSLVNRNRNFETFFKINFDASNVQGTPVTFDCNRAQGGAPFNPLSGTFYTGIQMTYTVPTEIQAQLDEQSISIDANGWFSSIEQEYGIDPTSNGSGTSYIHDNTISPEMMVVYPLNWTPDQPLPTAFWVYRTVYEERLSTVKYIVFTYQTSYNQYAEIKNFAGVFVQNGGSIEDFLSGISDTSRPLCGLCARVYSESGLTVDQSSGVTDVWNDAKQSATLNISYTRPSSITNVLGSFTALGQITKSIDDCPSKMVTYSDRWGGGESISFRAYTASQADLDKIPNTVGRAM